MKMAGMPTKINRKISTCPFYLHSFSSFGGRYFFSYSWTFICKIIQPLDLLFLVVFISFYVSRYHFSQIFKTSFSIIWKKDFRHEFPFFYRFTQPPPPLTDGQNPLSVTKVFCRFSLNVKRKFFSRIPYSLFRTILSFSSILAWLGFFLCSVGEICAMQCWRDILQQLVIIKRLIGPK